MNKRIDKLLVKAGAYFGGEGVDYSNFDPEKFAELIVDECCLKLLSMDEKAKGTHNYYKHAALEIKEHFGVDE